MLQNVSKTIKNFGAETVTRVVGAGRVVSSGFLSNLKRISAPRRYLLSAVELTGIVLVTYAISFWSVPSALIIGGLALIAAIEVRPAPVPKVPRLLPPIELLRQQAESAAMLINQDRLGLGFIEPNATDNLSAGECERLIITARALAVSKK